MVNYTAYPDWHQEVLRLTDGRGVDITIENVGVATWSKSIQATAQSGRVILVGLLSGFDESKSGPIFMLIFMRETMVTSVHVGSRDMFIEMN